MGTKNRKRIDLNNQKNIKNKTKMKSIKKCEKKLCKFFLSMAVKIDEIDLVEMKSPNNLVRNHSLTEIYCIVSNIVDISYFG